MGICELVHMEGGGKRCPLCVTLRPGVVCVAIRKNRLHAPQSKQVMVIQDPDCEILIKVTSTKLQAVHVLSKF